MIKYTQILIAFLFFQTVHAQNLCNNIVNAGDFSISSDKICLLNGGGSISVTDLSGGTNINYIFDYQGEAPDKLENLFSHSTAKTYNYTKTGTYTILQYGTKGGPIYACKTIKVVEMKDFAVRVKSCDNSNELAVIIENNTLDYDAYEIQWENGNVINDAKMGVTYKYNYTSSKPQNIQIRAKFNDSQGNGCTKPKDINLETESGKPLITKLEMPADNQAIVGFQGNATDAYQLYYRLESENTWTLSANNQPTQLAGVDYEVKANNLDITKNYCFKIKNNNGCSNPVESDEVCSIKLNATYKGVKTDVSWTTYNGVNTYNLERIDNAGSTNTTVSGTSYSDTEISCNQEVCYRAWIAIGNASIYSNKKCVKGGGENKAPALETINLDINSDGYVLLTAIELDNLKQKYIFLRADSPNGVFKEIGSAGIPNFTDKTTNTNKQSYCYKIQYEDLCKNLSNPSAPICSMYCSVDANGKVTWTPFETPLGVISYKIYYTDANGYENAITIPNINVREYDIRSVLPKDLSKTSIYIQAITNPPAAFPDFGPFYSFSNVVRYIIPAKISLPTGFTPNGDNKNDVFLAIADPALFDSFQMLVYNSWGELLFESNDILMGWDGKYKNQDMPTGTYAYKVFATDLNGKTIQKIGTVLLIR